MKTLPCVLCLGCVIHVALLLLGVTLPVWEYLTVIIFDYLMFLLSREFSFCLLHRLQIGYVALFYTCVMLQKWDVFGEYITAARIVMLSLGAVLMIWTIIKQNCHGIEDETLECASRDCRCDR